MIANHGVLRPEDLNRKRERLLSFLGGFHHPIMAFMAFMAFMAISAFMSVHGLRCMANRIAGE